MPSYKRSTIFLWLTSETIFFCTCPGQDTGQLEKWAAPQHVYQRDTGFSTAGETLLSRQQKHTVVRTFGVFRISKSKGYRAQIPGTLLADWHGKLLKTHIKRIVPDYLYQ